MSKPAGKQSSLLGFFKKAPPPSASNTPRPSSSQSQTTTTKSAKAPATPLTPSTSHAGSSSASEKSIKDSGVAFPAASALPAGRARRSSASSASKHTIDLSSDGAIEEDDEAAGNGNGTAASTMQKYASKGLTGAVASGSAAKSSATSSSATRRKTSSPTIPTPPLTSENESATTGATSNSEMDVDGEDEGDGSEGGNLKRAAKSRSAKRQIILSDGEDEESDAGSSSDVPPKKKAKALSQTKKKITKADSPFSLDEESDDYSDGGIDWDEAVKSDIDDMKPLKKKAEPKAKPEKKAAKGKATPAPKRPTMKHKGSSNPLLTWAEQDRQDRQEAYANEGEVFDFLLPQNRRDKYKKRPDDPDYDPKTLYIPREAENKFTAFEKQFWDIKKNHMDTVLFFQKGKFFELYENDAMIGHQVFDLKLTSRVKMSMVGVPEASIEYWTAKFLGQGFKVGRVDQAETAIGADLRRQDANASGKSKSKASTEPKIVHRELKTVLTTGTIVDGQLLTDDLSSHCIAVKEYLADGDSDPKFGVVIADCSTASFTLSGFEDDRCRTKLETTIRQHKPRELICEKGNLSVPTLRLLRACVGPDCTWNYLKPGIEFLSPADARTGIEDLMRSSVRQGEDGDIDEDDLQDVSELVPEEVKKYYDNDEAMSAIGGMLWYLKGLNLDRDLVSVKNFNIFDPIRDGDSLILDGQTLAHIEILQNSSGTDEGTLFKLLCRCTTPFGKRLFKIWVCQPLRSCKAINDRLNAVEDIMQSQPFQDTFDRLTKGMPDLERLLSRIHAGSCRTADFLKVLSAMSSASSLFDKLADAASDFKSPSIPGVLRRAPDLEKRVENIRSFFKVDDHELKPVKGKDADFDTIAKRVRNIENELDDQLNQYKKELKCKELAFKHMGTKDIYQMECSVKQKVPRDWTKVSGTATLSRYYSKEIEELVQNLKEARERLDQAVKVFQLKVYREFSKDYLEWLQAVKVIAELDCLVSLAKSSVALGEPAVRPEIVDEPQASVQFDELRHPCIFTPSADFIPNSVNLGGSNKDMVLLTGPNMAGKSTLLRMTCVGVILAQLGCYVPAKSARISPCDRIVSRMGAADNMLAGQSTFRVEMEDCKKILVEATPKTLVILDELGRGTSTFDGLSIAYAVLHQLAGHLGCIGFFATHFTSLVEDFAHHPEIALKHLKTFVNEDTREVTFLYKLTDGSSPKSYGPHVASMAGVPSDVVERAIAVSKTFEERTKVHEASKKQNQALSLDLQADASFLLKLASQDAISASSNLLRTLNIIYKKVTSPATTA